jgi:uncharacterized protein YijF (DUF1287 family)
VWAVRVGDLVHTKGVCRDVSSEALHLETVRLCK